ncbi:hypothetical protein SAMN05443245_1743 [Paraburkholderia fungorum]|uniref:Uncharacterized protein n=1 Tax=Paraburkholderia fungorum TaxID=134537 RepID=A0A1H1BNY9_9BURK|nr:hypothetical protein [Paraburkholderia fungorum]SDQ53599.1 hypothetical protein SAMN05443245_1743 [Paraburkholderia fungorum]
MKTSPQSSDGDKLAGTQSSKPGDKQADPHADKQPRSMQDAAAPLPHETDQNPESQHEDEPRHVGKQAHRDVERGLKDTDRRGGDEYQQKTQNDAHTDVNSDGKQAGAAGHRKH